MIQGNFVLLNVDFIRKGGGHWVFMTGEIMNSSNRNYSSAVFRLSVFERMHLLWAGSIRVINFRRHQTRSFEVQMEKLGYEYVPRITRHEIFFESGY